MRSPRFEGLPDDSRLWLVALERPLDDAQQQRLGAGLDDLLASWRHKGHVYEGAWALLERQILAVAEPTMAAAPSGCAIDGFFRKLARLRESAGLASMPEDAVMVRGPEGLRPVVREALASEIAAGRLAAETPVADLALYSLGQLRRGELWKPLRATWIGRKFRVVEASA